ncbi:MAG: heavy-metal-associated domain-containing protein [Chlorobium sp.]|nr:MAG: heavy-metal-associated domain-containing protein [Chlorobium sp.]
MACLCEHKEFMEIEWEVPTIESKECAEIVGLALEEIAEVRGVKVNLLSKTVTVCFDDTKIGLQQLKEAMIKVGFPAVLA